jgi:hypothetical protein
VDALRSATRPCGIRADGVAAADRNWLPIFNINARFVSVVLAKAKR